MNACHQTILFACSFFLLCPGAFCIKCQMIIANNKYNWKREKKLYDTYRTYNKWMNERTNDPTTELNASLMNFPLKTIRLKSVEFLFFIWFMYRCLRKQTVTLILWHMTVDKLFNTKYRKAICLASDESNRKQFLNSKISNANDRKLAKHKQISKNNIYSFTSNKINRVFEWFFFWKKKVEKNSFRAAKYYYIVNPFIDRMLNQKQSEEKEVRERCYVCVHCMY